MGSAAACPKSGRRGRAFAFYSKGLSTHKILDCISYEARPPCAPDNRRIKRLHVISGDFLPWNGRASSASPLTIRGKAEVFCIPACKIFSRPKKIGGNFFDFAVIFFILHVWMQKTPRFKLGVRRENPRSRFSRRDKRLLSERRKIYGGTPKNLDPAGEAILRLLCGAAASGGGGRSGRISKGGCASHRFDAADRA